MNNDIHELNIDELDTVSGGRLNLGQFAWFHPTYQTSFGNNNGSPLYGNGSFHDTIDSNNNLP